MINIDDYYRFTLDNIFFLLMVLVPLVSVAVGIVWSVFHLLSYVGAPDED